MLGLMRLPGRTDYALRAVLELAASPDGPVTTDELSRRQDIPTSYLGAILAELRKAGLVRARRGPDGGWTLGRPADQIALADVIRVIGGALTDVAGSRPEDLHYTGPATGLPQVLIALRAAERQILEAVTLADVVSGHLPPAVERLTQDPAAWH
jgi:Rrf2 family protein